MACKTEVKCGCENSAPDIDIGIVSVQTKVTFLSHISSPLLVLTRTRDQEQAKRAHDIAARLRQIGDAIEQMEGEKEKIEDELIKENRTVNKMLSFYRLIHIMLKCKYDESLIGQKLEALGIQNASMKLAQIQWNKDRKKALTERIKTVADQQRDLPVFKADDGTVLIHLKQLAVTDSILFSQPFYMEVPRYKLCIEVISTVIDEDDENGHLSIIVHVMKGDFDSVLEWPFQHSVTITLPRNIEGSDDIARTYHPLQLPVQESVVQGQPTSEEDITFGGEFASYSELQQNGNNLDDGICLLCQVENCY